MMIVQLRAITLILLYIYQQIPLKLNMVNFLSYRGVAPTLDLEGVHVACLTGNNGHGKSAILDAITWVLWGTARASSQEELICHDEPEMMVELEF